MSDEELEEVYGIGWAAYHDEQVLRSVREHSVNEPATSWIGQSGLPLHLNELPLHSPVCSSIDGTEQFEQGIAAFFEGNGSGGEVTIPFIWNQCKGNCKLDLAKLAGGPKSILFS